jgi:hypothetical protein
LIAETSIILGFPIWLKLFSPTTLVGLFVRGMVMTDVGYRKSNRRTRKIIKCRNLADLKDIFFIPASNRKVTALLICGKESGSWHF